MFCTNCGKKLGDTDKFCAGCGAEVKAFQDETISLQQPQPQPQPQVYANAPSHSKKCKKGLWITAACIAISLVSVVGTVLLMKVAGGLTADSGYDYGKDSVPGYIDRDPSDTNGKDDSHTVGGDHGTEDSGTVRVEHVRVEGCELCYKSTGELTCKGHICDICKGAGQVTCAGCGGTGKDRAGVFSKCVVCGGYKAQICLSCTGGKRFYKGYFYIEKEVVAYAPSQSGKMDYSLGLIYTLNDDGASYTVSDIGDCGDAHIIIPAKHPEDGKPITAIGESAFSYYDGLAKRDWIIFTEITIPNSIKSIGKHAFSYVKSLKKINIPESVISIGEEAFIYCSGLTNITLPENLSELGSGAFEGCTGLTSIKIPERISVIGNSLFLAAPDLPR